MEGYLFANSRWRGVDFDGCGDEKHFEMWLKVQYVYLGKMDRIW
jgi:hypothetical protein